MGIEPTGLEVEIQAIQLGRVEDGRIVETRVVWDTLGLLWQISAVHQTPAA